jgi:hypothetical protein
VGLVAALCQWACNAILGYDAPFTRAPDGVDGGTSAGDAGATVDAHADAPGPDGFAPDGPLIPDAAPSDADGDSACVGGCLLASAPGVFALAASPAYLFWAVTTSAVDGLWGCALTGNACAGPGTLLTTFPEPIVSLALDPSGNPLVGLAKSVELYDVRLRTVTRLLDGVMSLSNATEPTATVYFGVGADPAHPQPGIYATPMGLIVPMSDAPLFVGAAASPDHGDWLVFVTGQAEVATCFAEACMMTLVPCGGVPCTTTAAARMAVTSTAATFFDSAGLEVLPAPGNGGATVRVPGEAAGALAMDADVVVWARPDGTILRSNVGNQRLPLVVSRAASSVTALAMNPTGIFYATTAGEVGAVAR